MLNMAQAWQLLLMGKKTSDGKLYQWDPTATDGTQKIYGVLCFDQKMHNYAGTDKDRWFGFVITRGFLKATSLLIPGNSSAGINGDDYELLVRAQLTQGGRFVLDDEPQGSLWAGWAQTLTKTADYTVVEADNNTLFNTIGDADAITFTLPSPRPGYRFGFYSAAAQAVTISGASGTPLISEGDAAAASVTLPDQIGVYAEVIGISTTKYLVVVADPSADVTLDTLDFSDNATGASEIKVPDNVADALSILDATFGDLLILTTTTASEKFDFKTDVDVAGDLAVTGGLDVTGLATFAKRNDTPESVTAAADSGAGSTITADVVSVEVDGVTNDANDWIVLPALADVPVGHQIRIACNAGSNFEVRTPASSGEKINNVDSDGTQELLATDTTVIVLTKVSTSDGWSAVEYPLAGGVSAAVTPD